MHKLILEERVGIESDGGGSSYCSRRGCETDVCSRIRNRKGRGKE